MPIREKRSVVISLVGKGVMRDLYRTAPRHAPESDIEGIKAVPEAVADPGCGARHNRLVSQTSLSTRPVFPPYHPPSGISLCDPVKYSFAIGFLRVFFHKCIDREMLRSDPQRTFRCAGCRQKYDE
jgi:hypothetical protein